MSLGWVADCLDFLSKKVRHGDERLHYWRDYAFRLEHELGEAVHRARCQNCGELVGGAGIEPATSTMSTLRSTTELTARDKTQTAKRKKGRRIKAMALAAESMSKKTTR